MKTKKKNVKQIPEVNLTLVSQWIGPIKADEKFRKSMAKILRFWNKNKHNSNLEVTAQFYHAILRMADLGFQIRKLKARWTCECDQDLKAYHSIHAEKLLKKSLKAYQQKNEEV